MQCALTRFTCAFPCSKKTTGEQTVKIPVERPYGVPKEVHSDEDVCEHELSRKNHFRQPASFQVGDLLLVHHSR